MKPIIEVNDLHKTYKLGENVYEVIKGINFKVYQGEFLAIIGKSGAGKSTFLHLLSGQDVPDKGEISIGGKIIHKMDDRELSLLRRRKIGFIYQAYNLLPELCVEENIELPFYLDYKKVEKEYVEYLIEKLKLSHLCKKFPSQLSGGEQQRVAIARALVMRPDILYADEPTGNLDQESGYTVLEMLKAMNRDLNQTILLVTHDMDIANMANKIIRIQDGRLCE